MKTAANISLITWVVCVGLLFPLSLYSQNEFDGRKMEDYLAEGKSLSKKDPTKSIYYYYLALTEAQKGQNANDLATIKNQMSVTYMNMGDYVTAYDILTSALYYCPPEEKRLEGEICVNICNCYIELNDIDKAFKYIDRAYQISKEIIDSSFLAHCYNTRGLVYLHLDDIENAEENFSKSLEIHRSLGNESEVATNLNNLCLYKGDSPKKIMMLREAISINDSLGYTRSLAENYNNLGLQYYNNNEPEKALSALDTAKRYATSVDASDLLLDNNLNFAVVFKELNDYQKAYDCLLYVYMQNLKSQNWNKLKSIEIDIIQKKLNNSEDAKKLQEQEYDLRRKVLMMCIVSLMVIVVLLVLVLYMYRTRQKKNIELLKNQDELIKQEKDIVELKLAYTNEELKYNRDKLTNFAFHVKERNDILHTIQDQIRQVCSQGAAQNPTQLKSIDSYISQYLSHNEESNLIIDETNADFIGRLSAIHPKLTKKEQRLASLLRIDLSSKEIATIVFSEPSSVDVARYRLRKKLNLDTDKKLSDYLKGI